MTLSLNSNILTPLSYMKIHGEERDTESLKSSYSKEKVVSGYFNLMRDQELGKEKERGLFLSTYSNVFADPPEKLDFSFVAMKKSFIKNGHKNPHIMVISSIVHMEYLITKARKSGIESDFDLIDDFADFMDTMNRVSKDVAFQEGLALPVSYTRAIGRASQFARENRIEAYKEVNWEDFNMEIVSEETVSDIEWDEDGDEREESSEEKNLDDSDQKEEHSKENKLDKDGDQREECSEENKLDDCGQKEEHSEENKLDDCGQKEEHSEENKLDDCGQKEEHSKENKLDEDGDQREECSKEKRLDDCDHKEEHSKENKLDEDGGVVQKEEQYSKSKIEVNWNDFILDADEKYDTDDSIDISDTEEVRDCTNSESLLQNEESIVISDAESTAAEEPAGKVVPDKVWNDYSYSEPSNKKAKLERNFVDDNENICGDKNYGSIFIPKEESSTDEESTEKVPVPVYNDDSHTEPSNKKSNLKRKSVDDDTAKKTIHGEGSKFKYIKIKKKSTEKIVDIINRNCVSSVITDTRYDLFMMLLNEGLMEIDDYNLNHLREKNLKSFKNLQVTMNAWGEIEHHTNFDSKIDHGTKVISIGKDGRIDLDSRKYRKRNIRGDLEAYDCTGGKMCSNSQCPFLLRNQKDPLVGNFRNITQFVTVNDVESCIFCESQGIKNTVKNALCPNSLYIMKTKNGKDIYSLGNHTCQCKYKLDMPKEFPYDFVRHRLGYHDAVNSTIRSALLEETNDTAEELISKCSNFVGGAKSGPTLKQMAMKGQPFKIDIDSLIRKLRQRDPNFILEYSDGIIVVSSTRSLELMYSGTTDDFFLDVCFSRLIATERLCVVALYTYDTMLRCVLKLATGYIKSENSKDISIFIITINKAIGKLCSNDSYMLSPKNMFVDFADSNKEAFILAGYKETDVKSMLVGCDSHFGDFVERNIGYFKNGLERSTFKQLSYDWRQSGTLTLAQSRFVALRDFIVQKSTNTKIVLSALEWWAERPYLTLKMYSSCTIFSANLAEVGHSPAKKKQTVPEAILQDCVYFVDEFARRVAASRGSKYAAGSGPTLLQSKVRYEKQVQHKINEIGNSLDVMEEMEYNNLQDPGPSGINNDPGPQDPGPQDPGPSGINNDPGPGPSGINNNPGPSETNNDHGPSGRISDHGPSGTQSENVTRTEKQRRRKKFSAAFNENYDRMKRLQVTVKAVLEDNENEKTISLHVRQTTGYYSGGENVKVTMSQNPLCTCQHCEIQKGKSGRSINSKLQVCAPQIWVRLRLFNMAAQDLDIVQIYYTKFELTNIFKHWKTPKIIDDRTADELRKIFEKKEKSMKAKIIYYIEKIDINTVNRNKICRSQIHGHQGFKLNTLNNLYIRADNALWIPSNENEAFKAPVYLCATKECSIQKPPSRCNIYGDKVPSIVKKSDHVHLTPSDIAKVLAEGFLID